jgi:ribosomal-protein-alanine N-acetyltransferase
MNVHIRPMKMKDIDKVYQLEKHLFKDSWSKNSFKMEMENDEISYPLILEVDGNVAGYAVVWFYAGELHIANFAIALEYQGEGLGSRLLDYIMNMSDSYHFAYLEVRESNYTAINLYKKAGFIDLYKRKKYYRDGENAIVMVYSK